MEFVIFLVVLIIFIYVKINERNISSIIFQREYEMPFSAGKLNNIFSTFESDDLYWLRIRKGNGTYTIEILEKYSYYTQFQYEIGVKEKKLCVDVKCHKMYLVGNIAGIPICIASMVLMLIYILWLLFTHHNFSVINPWVLFAYVVVAVVAFIIKLYCRDMQNNQSLMQLHRVLYDIILKEELDRFEVKEDGTVVTRPDKKKKPNTIENRYAKAVEDGKEKIKKQSILAGVTYLLVAGLGALVCVVYPNNYPIIPILYLLMAAVSFGAGQYFRKQTKILFERGEVIWKTINMTLFCFLLESFPALILFSCDDFEVQKIGIFTYLIFIIVFIVIGILLGFNQHKTKKSNHWIVLLIMSFVLIGILLALGLTRRRIRNNFLQEYWISLFGLNNYNVLVIVLLELAMCVLGLFFVPEIVSNILKIKGWKKR